MLIHASATPSPSHPSGKIIVQLRRRRSIRRQAENHQQQFDRGPLYVFLRRAVCDAAYRRRQLENDLAKTVTPTVEVELDSE